MASSTLSSMKLCERLRAARFLLRNRYLGRQLRLQRERSASNGCLVTTWRQREGVRERGRERERRHRERDREREKQGESEREAREREEGDIHCNKRRKYMYTHVHICTSIV